MAKRSQPKPDALIVDNEAEALLAPIGETAMEPESAAEAPAVFDRRRKLGLLACAVLAFFLSLLFFFPYEQAIVFLVSKYVRGLKVDAGRMDISLFGRDTLERLRIQLPDRTFLSAERVDSGLGHTDLLMGELKGTVSVDDLLLETGRFGMRSRNVVLESTVANILGPVSSWQGDARIAATGIEIMNLPEDKLPLPIKPSDLKVKSLNVQSSVNGGVLRIADAAMKSNLFDLAGRGQMKISEAGIGTVSFRFCIKPVANLESENSMLYGLYKAAGGDAELCFTLSGAGSEIRFQKENEK